jgi:hypothetical protein
VQVDPRVAGGPPALELHGVLAHRRPGVPDAQPPLPGAGFPGQVVDLGQHAARPAQHPLPRRGRHDHPAGAAQQADAERVLQRGQRPGHGRLRHPELRGSVGEATGIDDRDEAAQVTQLDVHALSVSLLRRMHFVNAGGRRILGSWKPLHRPARTPSRPPGPHPGRAAAPPGWR